MNLRDQFLAAQDKGTMPVEIPEWGSGYYIRQLSQDEKHKLFAPCYKNGHIDDEQAARSAFEARVVLMTLSDSNGNPILNEKDLQAVGAKNGAVVSRVAKQALLFQGQGVEAKEEIKND